MVTSFPRVLLVLTYSIEVLVELWGKPGVDLRGV